MLVLSGPSGIGKATPWRGHCWADTVDLQPLTRARPSGFHFVAARRLVLVERNDVQLKTLNDRRRIFKRSASFNGLLYIHQIANLVIVRPAFGHTTDFSSPFTFRPHIRPFVINA